MPSNWLLFFFTVIVVAVLFSALGIVSGILAEKFDHLALTTTFFITPLVFVGGGASRISVWGGRGDGWQADPGQGGGYRDRGGGGPGGRD